MTDQTNASEPTSDGVKTQDEEKKPEVKKPEATKPSITLMEGQSSILVKVGADDKAVTWSLPKGLLTHVSPFFEAALNRPWLESKTESLNLPEDDPEAFRFFLRWLFAWILSKPGDYPKTVSRDATSYVYLRAWVLGDKLNCPRFQDFAYVHLRRAQPMVTDLMSEIHRKTPEGSKLRQWMIYTIAGWIKEDSFKSENVQDTWTKFMTDYEDVAADIVKFQIHNTKRTMSDFLLVSNWNDFVFTAS
ncbi:MAG: hypothetical protein L6R38_000610 [Xanthoria sp. 2 TBL-2021]|nr:MAG: hypothetical protein L6R38_000610 [Xanthoria sp. 2 TBL-2021]